MNASELARRYAAAVVDALAYDFPALKDDSLGRLVPKEIARQAEAPSRMFELIVDYAREWRLHPAHAGGDQWRVCIGCHKTNPTAADAEREQHINTALRAIEL